MISVTEKLISQDLKIQNQKETIQNFEDIYKKNPGIKEAKYLSFLQKKLADSITKLKSVAAELNLYRFKQNTSEINIRKKKETIVLQEKKLSKVLKTHRILSKPKSASVAVSVLE